MYLNVWGFFFRLKGNKNDLSKKCKHWQCNYVLQVELFFFIFPNCKTELLMWFLTMYDMLLFRKITTTTTKTVIAPRWSWITSFSHFTFKLSLRYEFKGGEGQVFWFKMFKLWSPGLKISQSRCCSFQFAQADGENEGRYKFDCVYNKKILSAKIFIFSWFSEGLLLDVCVLYCQHLSQSHYKPTEIIK